MRQPVMAKALLKPLTVIDLSYKSGQAAAKLRELLEVSRQPEQLITWSISDLLRKLHTASQLLRRGASSGQVVREIRLWGTESDAVMNAARRLEPQRIAQLLREFLNADRRTKTGIGKAARTLEAMAVQIADTLGCV